MPGLIKTVRPNVDHYAADQRDGSAQVPTKRRKKNPRTEPISKTADFVLDLNGKALLDPHASPGPGNWENLSLKGTGDSYHGELHTQRLQSGCHMTARRRPAPTLPDILMLHSRQWM